MTPPRSDTTRDALMAGALEELALLGYRRSSMESVARRAGVSRATLYLHFDGKDDLVRALVTRLHDDHEAAMTAAIAAPAPDFETRLRAVLDARFGRWVEITATSPQAVELYDEHSRLCGDLARASQERSEKQLARFLRDADRAGEIDLGRLGLSASHVAGVLFDCAHGAKGEDPAVMTTKVFRTRLKRIVHVLVNGMRPV